MRSFVKRTMAGIDRVFKWICMFFPEKLRKGLIERYHRLWTFCFFGCINTVIDYGVYALLYYVLDAPIFLSQAIGLLCGSSNGYLLNSTITFRDGQGGTTGKYFQYIGVDIVLALITGAFMQWAEQHIALPVYLLKICVTAAAAIIHYIVYKTLVFRIGKENIPNRNQTER